MKTPGKSTFSQQERCDLILAHLPRVRWIAARIRDRLPQAVALEDLISIGVLGLIVAIDRFDTSQNVKLSTYADYRIRGSILDSVRSLDGVPAHKRPRKKLMAYRRNRRRATAERRPGRRADRRRIGNPGEGLP
jgi:RNA polymerase sigma factor FliA